MTAPLCRYLSVSRFGEVRIGKTIHAQRVAIVQVDDAYQAERLRRIIWGFARKGYAPHQWLVPGMPEAVSLDARQAALARFMTGLETRMKHQLRPGAWRVLVRGDWA